MLTRRPAIAGTELRFLLEELRRAEAAVGGPGAFMQAIRPLVLSTAVAICSKQKHPGAGAAGMPKRLDV